MTRYEIIDSQHPEWQGMKFSSLERARKELARAIPPGRFYIVEKQKGSRKGTKVQ